MPIRWSALKVSEAMDRVEHQINLAEVFLPEARSIASQVRQVDNLPGYLDDRLRRLIYAIERLDEVKASIEAIRKAIPDGAIEAERKRLRRGSQQSLIPGPDQGQV
ncbi:hypothetical protein M1O54_00230 [Dehalococcoidia bacterium]|nr:hypothetical protein [Dehalococcoidia bacterium]MCL0102828.1 hypothetical protein [Dehalococcoidia bacterium]